MNPTPKLGAALGLTSLRKLGHILEARQKGSPVANGKYKYDVFISYSSEDRDWAAKVKGLLGTRRIFFDQSSIRAGDDWETKIMESLEASQNLVVLWSDHARASDWVQHEVMVFKKLAPAGRGTNRRLIPLNLQGRNALLNAYQQINQADVQGAYPTIANAKDEAWREIKEHLELGLDPNREPMEVPVLILTLTRDRIDRFDDVAWKEIERAWGVDRKILPQFYDKERSLWRPFGGTHTVGQILEEIRKEVDKALPTRRLAWRYPAADFWTDIDAAGKFLNEEFETSELSLLVLDPIALHDLDEVRRLQMASPALGRSSAAIVILPPFAPSDRVTSFRQAVDKGSRPLFDGYFRPSVPPRNLLRAQLCWNASDTSEIQRYFLHAAGASSKAHEHVTVSPYVNHGDP